MTNASGGFSPVGAAAGDPDSLLMSSFSSLPGLKYGTFFAQPETILDVLTIGIIEFRDMAEAFDAFIQLDEHSKRRVANDTATDQISYAVAGEELLPHIRLQLLDPKRQPVIISVDVQDHRIDALTFL